MKARIAQWLERDSYKVEVPGSNPGARISKKYL